MTSGQNRTSRDYFFQFLMTNYMNVMISRGRRTLVLFSLLCLLGSHLRAQEKDTEVVIVWNERNQNGSVEISNGRLKSITIPKEKGKTKENRFTLTGDPARLFLKIADTTGEWGPEPTIVHIKTEANAFSFFLRDVSGAYPIFIPQYGVAVLPKGDERSYSEIKNDIANRKTFTKLEKIQIEQETSFNATTGQNRNMTAPTWLGISRDMRIFEVSKSTPDASIGEANIISPKLSSSALRLEATNNTPVNYLYTLGRGVGVQSNLTRRLEQGVLPILNSTLADDDVVYHSTVFATLEVSRINELKGTDFLVADQHSAGHMFTEEQLESLKVRKPAALNTTEETVLLFRSKIINKGDVPRYAWFKTPRPGTGWWQNINYSYDYKNGYSLYGEDQVFCVSRLNGTPLPNEEIAILLQPGEEAIVEFYLPHRPISLERAAKLQSLDFDDKLIEAKSFWLRKLEKAAKIKVPEKRINEMIQAGLLHLDLITFGNEPHSTLAPNIGVYSPIGTESSPIIQYYASVGWTEQARRSLNYFLEKQHENGFIQNFGGYMVETGAALWSIGEYFRYTRDRQWVLEVKDKLIKSCNYLIDWRNRNKKQELIGKGYGMIDGKVADPEDHFHQFMLNGYAYLGLSRVAELLKEIDPAEHTRLTEEADTWKNDIQQSLYTTMSLSPVVPLGNGTWSPTCPPWTEGSGLRALYLKREKFWSHGTFTAPDALLGPLYLVFCEVIDPRSVEARMMLDYHSELFFQGNSAFSQPYYSRHNWLQAKLGMVKPFLNTYYNTVSAHADRETYTFWEHMYRVSPHKTHEEAWFLMETRWMLYMEEGDTLNLLKTIPRAWMEDGKEIQLDGVKSYFGNVVFSAKSEVNKGFIEASVECSEERKPATVTIRLPHPENKRPSKVAGGVYDPEKETITIENFSGSAQIRLDF